MKRISIAIVAVLLVLTNSSLFAQQVSKTYRVSYKTVTEFEPLVRAILSNRGELEISVGLNLMVVRDNPANLADIDSLFFYYDQPAQQFLVNIYLLLGSNDDKAVSSPDSVLIHELLDPLFSFTKYEELDKAYLRTEEKLATTFDLAEGQFNVSFDMDYIRSDSPLVRFRSFALSESIRQITGVIMRPVYVSSIEMPESQLQLFTAVRHEGSGKTLILLVSASRIQ